MYVIEVIAAILALLLIVALLAIIILVICSFFPASSEMEEFSPEDSRLKPLLLDKNDHIHLLSMMRRLDGVLKRHDIPYFLMSGTLLGAVRYENRMPWDDDIDIGVVDDGKLEKINFSDAGLILEESIFGYKVFDIYSDHLFIDIFLYVDDGKELRLKFPEAAQTFPLEASFSKEMIYPLTTRRYGKLKLPCPQKSISYLNNVYPGWNRKIRISGDHKVKLGKEIQIPVNPLTNKQVREYLKRFN